MDFPYIVNSALFPALKYIEVNRVYSFTFPGNTILEHYPRYYDHLARRLSLQVGVIIDHHLYTYLAAQGNSLNEQF